MLFFFHSITPQRIPWFKKREAIFTPSGGLRVASRVQGMSTTIECSASSRLHAQMKMGEEQEARFLKKR